METVITIKIESDTPVKVNVEQTKTEMGTKKEYSQYAKFFDETNPYWQKDSEYNLMFIRQQEIYANELLKTHRHLFLNDVYKMLGLTRTKAGQVVGWVYDEHNPIADNYVSFGLYREQAADFVNGRKNTILLDFNVDGIILDKIGD
jgi:hypothetical protein